MAVHVCVQPCLVLNLVTYNLYAIINNGNLPRLGVLYMLQEIFTLIVAPLFVGLVIELVSRWLDEKDDN